MSLRTAELEARIWRVARERMAKRPKVLAEYLRRRWGRWLEMCGLLVAGVALPMPVFGLAIQFGNGQFLANVLLPDVAVLVLSAGMVFTGLVLAWTWHHAARTDSLWSVGTASPISDQVLARHWMVWRVGFAGVFVAPLATSLTLMLSVPLGGWQAASVWGTLLAIVELGTLLTTTLLCGVLLGRWLGDWLWTISIHFVLLMVTILSVWPIQRLPRGGIACAGRRLLWWPTGWPLATLEAVWAGDNVRALWLMAASCAWCGLGLVAAIWLIRCCSIREFSRGRFGSQLAPLFDRDSVWGPRDEAQPRELSKWEQALAGGQTPPVLDLVKLETADEPLSAEEARREVLRGEFLQPLPDDRLGWMEKVLLLSLSAHERSLARHLMLDGRYWTRAITIWWGLIWTTAIWFRIITPLLNGIRGNPGWMIVVAVVTVCICLAIASALATVWIVFFGWPGWIWINSAVKGLPIFAHLPIGPRDLASLRQRITLQKLVVALVLLAPVLLSIAWMQGVPAWPILKVFGKLAFVLFIGQTWWFLAWQLSGAIFRTIAFYITTIGLMVGQFALAIYFVVNDDHIEWTAPTMVLCAKLTTWLLHRTLDTPVFDLTGANLGQQNRGVMLQVEPPQAPT